MKTYRIAVIAGDGIGKEVVPAGIEVLNLAADQGGFKCEFTSIPWGCDYYLSSGRMMDADGIDQLLKFDAIYLGAIGDPRVADHISARELILPLRQRLGQYVNLRPMRLMPGIDLAARQPRRRRHRHDLRARELGRRVLRHGRPAAWRHAAGAGGSRPASSRATASSASPATRSELAATRPRKMLASATKSNALQHAMVLWDEVVADVAKEFPQVELRKYHVDALCARMVTHPQTLDVIVASNLFGDILTDIGSAISGSLGVAPGANINPERTTPSMFEPIHGSAPDIAGKGIANPIARNLGGSDDARPPRRAGGARSHPGGDRTGACRAATSRRRTSAAGRRRRRCRRRSLPRWAPRHRHSAYGGNPTDSLIAAYSGWTVPSAARITSGGSTQVRCHMRSGRSAARHRIQADQWRVALPEYHRPASDDRERRLARRLLHTLPLVLGKHAGEQAAARQVSGGDPGVVTDVPAKFEPTRHFLWVVAFDAGTDREIGRAAEHQVEPLVRPRTSASRKSAYRIL